MKPRRPRRAARVATTTATEEGDSLSSRVFTGDAAKAIRDRDLHIDALLPLAATGKKIHNAYLNRQSAKDRAEFLRLGGDLRKRSPRLDVNALLACPELADLVERYPERVAVWVRELYPKRGRGRPREK